MDCKRLNYANFVPCQWALKNAPLAKSSPNRIQLTLLKVGMLIIRNTYRIRSLMSSVCPHHEWFHTVASRLNSL